MNTQLVIDRFQMLPDEIQGQVLDYIDFLIQKYAAEKSSNVLKVDELAPETKKILDKRLVKHKKNPSKAKSWKEVENRLLNKNK
ncbi:MAG TPA: hypothetical protein DCQ31_17055 [Bacteroidales bacterium]|nr:hypothetical protein [Bacteroidales bacterium]